MENKGQSNIKVVILAGGLGTRLREETEFRPKPMVNIGSHPILWHIMKIYAHYGFKEFVLCLGYKGEMIKEYFYNYKVLNDDFTIELGHEKDIEIHSNHGEKGWRITLVDTGDKALKGSRIKQVEKYIQGDTFMLTYGDGVSDIDINKLVGFHRSHGKMVTLTGISPSSQFGELKVEGNQVKSFQEKPEQLKSESWISGGFFVCSRRIFDYLTIKEDCDFEFGALEQIANEGKLIIYKHSGFWACMDTSRDVERLNRLWEEGKAGWKIW